MAEKKKNILITGDSKGIGKAIKESLAEHNIFSFSRTFGFDITDKTDIKRFSQRLHKNNTIFDAIILNAGIGEFGKFEEISLEKSENIISVNLLGNIRLLKILEENINNKTTIIFIGSVISKKFLQGAGVYQASKFGIRGLAGGLKAEGKKAFLINPKIVDTDFHKDKIELDKNYPKTNMSDIITTVINIIGGDEKRFEIDL